jgi:hypothetical protein
MDTTSSVAIILAVLSVVVAALSFGAVLWQGQQAARANELSAFISLETLSRKMNYGSGIDIISRIKSENLEDFRRDFTQVERQQVRECVEFLNFAAHLVEGGFLPRQRVWDIYFMSFRLVGIALQSWWFAGERQNLPQRFISTERMCRQALSVSDAEIDAYNRKKQQ